MHICNSVLNAQLLHRFPKLLAQVQSVVRIPLMALIKACRWLA